jgi:hypothetical protein
VCIPHPIGSEWDYPLRVLSQSNPQSNSLERRHTLPPESSAEYYHVAVMCRNSIGGYLAEFQRFKAAVRFGVVICGKMAPVGFIYTNAYHNCELTLFHTGDRWKLAKSYEVLFQCDASPADSRCCRLGKTGRQIDCLGSLDLRDWEESLLPSAQFSVN